MAPQLRLPIFPGPPFLTFLPPGEAYDHEQILLDVPWHLWSPCTNPLMLDCLCKAGYRLTQNTRLEYEGLTGLVWDTLCPAARAAVLLKTTDAKVTLHGLLSNAACDDLYSLDDEAKVNRLPGTQVICCKMKLARRHQKFQQKFGKTEFDFIPQTFSLLDEREEMLHDMMTNMSQDARSDGEPLYNRKVWIVKPIGLSRGRGIFLTDCPMNLPSTDKAGHGFLVQRYLTEPYLINNRKFDLRVYVLVTGVDPLKVYIYKDGFIRFAIDEYDGGEDIGNRCAHITNVALHKDKVDGYLGQRNDFFSGFKWTLKTLRMHLRKQGVDWSTVWSRVEDVCLKTVLLAHSHMQEAARGLRSSYSCYKLLGIDVLLDSELRPWVLEVNSDPVLKPDSVDFPVKSRLIPEMFNILGLHIPQAVAEAKSVELENQFPGITRYSHDISAYRRSMDERQWTDSELQEAMAGGRLEERQAVVLRQMEEELSQTDMFTRLLPSASSARYLHYMRPPPAMDRLGLMWEKWKLEHPNALQSLQPSITS